MREETKYISDDGQIFDTPDQALEHDEQVKVLQGAEEFADALLKAGHSARIVKMRKNIAFEYLMWQATGEVAEVNERQE